MAHGILHHRGDGIGASVQSDKTIIDAEERVREQSITDWRVLRSVVMVVKLGVFTPFGFVYSNDESVDARVGIFRRHYIPNGEVSRSDDFEHVYHRNWGSDCGVRGN